MAGRAFRGTHVALGPARGEQGVGPLRARTGGEQGEEQRERRGEQRGDDAQQHAQTGFFPDRIADHQPGRDWSVDESAWPTRVVALK